MSTSRSSRSSSSRAAEPSSSSQSRGASDRRQAPAFPSKVAIVGAETAFGTYLTETVWPEPEFVSMPAVRHGARMLICGNVLGRSNGYQECECQDMRGHNSRSRNHVAPRYALPLAVRYPADPSQAWPYPARPCSRTACTFHRERCSPTVPSSRFTHAWSPSFRCRQSLPGRLRPRRRGA